MLDNDKNAYNCLFGDKRGYEYIKSFLKTHGSIIESINKVYTNDLYLYDNAWNIMRTKYYTGFNEETLENVNISENDIHYEFTNLIALLAHRLNNLDKSIENTTKLFQIVNNIKQQMNKHRTYIKKEFLKNNRCDSTYIENVINSVININNNLYTDLVRINLDQFKNDACKQIKIMFYNVCTVMESYYKYGMIDNEIFDNSFNLFYYMLIFNTINIVKQNITSSYHDSYTTINLSIVGKQLIEHVYSKWDNLSSDCQYFFSKYMDLQKRHHDNTFVNINDYTIDPTNYINYRINLRKNLEGSLLIKDIIPYIPSLVNEYFYTDLNNGKIKGNKIIKNDDLRTFFDKNYYMNNVNLDKVITLIGSPKYNLNIKQIVIDKIKLLLQDVNTFDTVSNVSPDTCNQNYCYDIQTQSLWRLDKHGDWKKNNNTKCFTTFIGDTPNNCKKYIYECLLTSDTNGLNECFKYAKLQGNLDIIINNDIINMHPLIAYRTLQRFNFSKYKTKDMESNRDIYKVERVEHWIDNYVRKQFKSADVDKIINDNTNLLKYLDMISQYVNNNLHILNDTNKKVTNSSMTFKQNMSGGNPNYMNRESIDWGLNNGCLPFMVYKDQIIDKYYCMGLPKDYDEIDKFKLACHHNKDSDAREYYKYIVFGVMILLKENDKAPDTDLLSYPDNIKDFCSIGKKMIVFYNFLSQYIHLYDFRDVFNHKHLNKFIEAYNKNEQEIKDNTLSDGVIKQIIDSIFD